MPGPIDFDFAFDPEETRLEPLNTCVPETVARIDQMIQHFCQQRTINDEDLRRVFQLSFECHDYAEVFTKRARILASAYVPGAIAAVGEKALAGNIPAAKLLFQLSGTINTAGQYGPVATAMINNLNVGGNHITLRELIEKTAQVVPMGEVIDAEHTTVE